MDEWMNEWMDEKTITLKVKCWNRKEKKGSTAANHLSQVIREESDGPNDGSYFCQTNVSIFGNITGNINGSSTRLYSDVLAHKRTERKKRNSNKARKEGEHG
jgi:hypothetical protein